MKKDVGSLLALYPVPVTVIGAMNQEKPTWTLVAHTGILGHDRVLVSLAAPHFINHCIKETGKLTINLVDEALLPLADYVGSVSGAKTDKSQVFPWEPGVSGAPVLSSSPLTLECSVETMYSTPNFENFICTIERTLVAEEHLDEKGKVNCETLKPVLFEFPTYRYLKTGEVLGRCLSFRTAPEKGAN